MCEVDESVNEFTWLLTLTNEYECAWPEQRAAWEKDGKLWSAEIEKLIFSAKRECNKVMRTTLGEACANNGEARKAFKETGLKKAKVTWRRFCVEMDHIPDFARIHKISPKDY